MKEWMRRVTIGISCSHCEQLVNDALFKTHQGRESVEKNTEGKRLWKMIETARKV